MLGMEGKTAIVTGGGRGIGRDIALLLAEYGTAVAVLDVDEAGAADTASRLGGRGAEGLAVRCDVTDPGEVERCVQAVLEWRDQVHFLVNNAGITRDNLLIRMSEREWESVLRVNLTGTFNLTKIVVKHMLKKRTGRIVNISSVIGVMGNAGQANYAASKAGIIGFTKAVAKEVASRGITVNAIAPGFIDTEMTAALPEERREEMRRRIPLGRFGTGADVARTVLFLLSELGSYVTGQVLHCDGGMVT
jgi:3-oxoacyl-[acyl-carrier protein] reductase